MALLVLTTTHLKGKYDDFVNKQALYVFAPDPRLVVGVTMRRERVAYDNFSGKTSQWEGGIRVNSWVSGGFLPAKVRGTKYEGLACGWDWCKCLAPNTTPV